MTALVDVLSAVGAVLYLGLAALMLRHSAGRRANAAFALLLVTQAAWPTLSALEAWTGEEALLRARNYTESIEPIALLFLAAAYLGPELRLPPWTRSVWPYALASGAVFALLAFDGSLHARNSSLRTFSDLLGTAWAVVPLVLAWRAARLEADRAASEVLLATGIALWWASATFDVLPQRGLLPPAVQALWVLRALLFVGLVLLLAQAAARTPARRGVLSTCAILVSAAITAGLAATLAGPVGDAAETVMVVSYALAAPLVVAYALLRHQLLGLDLKVRFAVGRSTLAGAFVAVFFLASEGAQLVVGDGNEWVGLGAAGALVFALAPLQRAAERLAERAVPSAAARPGAAAAGKEELYRKALRLALKDARLTREEETHLHELAEELGIPGSRAHAMLAETEREARAGREEVA